MEVGGYWGGKIWENFRPKKSLKVDKKVIGVEMNHLGEVFPGSRGDLHQFLNQQNYDAYVKFYW